MAIRDTEEEPTISVRGTQILATDTPQRYRQKLARIALDEMYQFVAVLDANGTLLEVNRAALEGAGLELSDVEGKPFWKCFWWAVSNEIQEALQAAVARAAQGEFIRYDVEIYGRASGRETIIIDFSMIPVKDATGRVVYIVAEGRDITEKKALEREIAQKNAELRALLERIRELDEIKTQFFANVSHELRTPARLEHAASPSPTADTSHARVLVIEDNPDMNRFISQALAAHYQVLSAFDGEEGLSKVLSFDPTLIISDIMMPKVNGAQMIARIRARPGLGDTPILVLSAQADDELRIRLLEEGAQDFIVKPFSAGDLLVRVRNLIAARQAMEVSREVERLKHEAVEERNRQLRARSEYLSELFQQAPGFMAVLRGPQHVFELANAAYLNLVGHRDVLGRPLLEVLPEVADQEFPALLDGVLATGEPYVGSARKVLLQREPDAPLEERYVDFVYQPLAGPDGSVTGVFVEGTDVTERRNAEEALRQADRRKDEFLATLAHELRNPLAPIRHAAKIARKSIGNLSQLKWSHDVIDRQVDHMSRLLDDLLDVSRITRGKLELRKQHLALGDCIAAAVEATRPMIEAKQHRIDVDVFNTEPVYVEADPVRLAQIFSNLLTNAAKYTDPRGRIRVHGRLAGEQVEVSVSDNGMGIAADMLPQVFEMFSQATSALERSEGGLGIGLSLVRGLVVLHNGSIEARSAGLGRGSEFVVRFPRSRRSSIVETRPVGGSTVTEARGGLRILVADDNRDSADSCRLLFEASGHTVRAAYTGQEALEIASEFRPQVALLDIGMPKMNGYELARRIRQTQWGGQTMLIAVTGWGQAEDKRQALNAGFDRHLTKPIDIDALTELLEGELSGQGVPTVGDCYPTKEPKA